jgi:predicted metal-binding protein
MDLSKKHDLTSHIGAVIYFITKLDIDMLDDILDENLTYQDFKKQKFLYQLQLVFEEFQKLGDTYLEIYDGKCNRCNKCDSGLSFIGNISKTYIDLIIKSHQGKVTDIFECSNFKNDSEGIVKKFSQFLDDKLF